VLQGAQDEALSVEGVTNGEGVYPSSFDYEVWGSVVSSPSGVRSGAEPWPKMNSMHFICHGTFLVEEKSISILTQMNLQSWESVEIQKSNSMIVDGTEQY